MTEPVAYLNKYKDKSTNIIIFKPIDNTALVSSNKLYTADQLHPRVKMTQAEFRKWEKLYKKFNGLKFKLILEELEENFEYYGFYKRFAWDNERISIFARLFFDYDTENPEETIEIVNNMKWFVRSKELNSENNYYYFVGKRPDDYWPTYGYKRAAKQFDTKEEADKWKNPLTEAVQLPVEGY